MTPLDWYLNDNYPGDEQRSALGRIHKYVTADSADPVWQQFEDNAASGWNPQLVKDQGWELSADEFLIFPGLPPLEPVAYAWHLGEKILVYPLGWTVIVQLGGDFSVARVR